MFSRVYIDKTALMHNLVFLKHLAKSAKFLAMVKSNAYGCGLKEIVPTLEGQVDAFGVATIEEAMIIRLLGAITPCLILQGVFTSQEWQLATEKNFVCVIHQQKQLEVLLKTQLSKPISIWLKINTGMNRLGFSPNEIPQVIIALNNCAWVKPSLTLMMHFANADNKNHLLNTKQIAVFQEVVKNYSYPVSVNNSAAIFNNLYPNSHTVRAGISLYGVSPFSNKTGLELGLIPVMHFKSIIIQTYTVASGASVGYGSIWQASKSSRLGVIPVGYGDGYPRVVHNAYVALEGRLAPIIGRISMNSMVVDITDFPEVTVNTPVELWGQNMPIEKVAQAAGTIAYELLSSVAAH